MVHVPQGERCRLVQPPLAWTFFDGIAQDFTQWAVGKLVDEFTAGVCLRVPFCRVAEAVGYRLVLNAFVEDAVL